MLNYNEEINGERSFRNQILKLTKEYVCKYVNNKNSNTINVTGKVIDREEVCNIVESGLGMWFTSGRFKFRFEEKIKKFIDVKYLLTCNSRSSANLIALSSLCNKYMMKESYIPKGSEVITCAVGFPTTINPIIANGLVPVFVDNELIHLILIQKILKKQYLTKQELLW